MEAAQPARDGSGILCAAQRNKDTADSPAELQIGV